MLPIVALGAAALAGAWITSEVAADSSKGSAAARKTKQPETAREVAQAVSPQSYIVTPIATSSASSAQQTQKATNLADLVGKMIF